VYLNPKRRSGFVPIIYTQKEANTYDIITGDLNGDGYPDIIEANSDALNLFYLNRMNNPKE
jgi:hypothetical protein